MYYAYVKITKPGTIFDGHTAKCRMTEEEFYAYKFFRTAIVKTGTVPQADPSIMSEYERRRSSSMAVIPTSRTSYHFPETKVVCRVDKEPPHIAVVCTCSEGPLCGEARDMPFAPTWELIEKSSLDRSARFCIQLFGLVLHRVDVSIKTERDWDGNETEMLCVSSLTHRPDPVTQFFSRDDIMMLRIHPLAWVGEMIRNEMHSEEYLLQYLSLAGRYSEGSSGDNGCSLAGHGYMSNLELKKFLTERRDHSDHTYRLLAHAFTTAVYSMCYICYRSCDLAFATLNID